MGQGEFAQRAMHNASYAICATKSIARRRGT
jgi:hypothetical protein